MFSARADMNSLLHINREESESKAESKSSLGLEKRDAADVSLHARPPMP